MNDNSTQHLDELYEYYRPNMDGIITADQILLKVKTTTSEQLNFDQHFNLLQDIVSEIRKVWDTYQKYNILVESKVNNALDWVFDTMPQELALLTIKLLMEFLPLEHNITKINRSKDFISYLTVIKAVN
jgi:hypothetical protein